VVSILGLDPHELPVIWDADFLYGRKIAAGADTYVPCEIKVSAAWPFPSMAAPTVAAAALDRARVILPVCPDLVGQDRARRAGRGELHEPVLVPR
jgi:hypothetical protein